MMVQKRRVALGEHVGSERWTEAEEEVVRLEFGAGETTNAILAKLSAAAYPA
jgi:tRNA U34 5-methylaminomethyl-2-thiouridine-forming methyltransferase MnmC